MSLVKRDAGRATEVCCWWRETLVRKAGSLTHVLRWGWEPDARSPLRLLDIYLQGSHTRIHHMVGGKGSRVTRTWCTRHKRGTWVFTDHCCRECLVALSRAAQWLHGGSPRNDYALKFGRRAATAQWLPVGSPQTTGFLRRWSDVA